MSHENNKLPKTLPFYGWSPRFSRPKGRRNVLTPRERRNRAFWARQYQKTQGYNYHSVSMMRDRVRGPSLPSRSNMSDSRLKLLRSIRLRKRKPTPLRPRTVKPYKGNH